MLRFNLIAMVRRARPVLARLGRRLKLREITPTGVLTGDLERVYGVIIRSWWSGVTGQLLTAYRTALEQSAPRPGLIMDEETGAPGLLQQVLDELRLVNDRLVIALTTDLNEWAIKLERWHRAKWSASMTPSGVNLQTMLTAEDVGDTVAAALRQNVSLVRNVSDQTRRRIEQIVFDGFTRRAPAQEIARSLVDAVGLERKRALRIASDQTLKLSSQLDTERMKQAGITKFMWRHSGKLHFRPHHKARDGQVFALDGEIDPDDMPGIPIFCGCKKQAVLDL